MTKRKFTPRAGFGTAVAAALAAAALAGAAAPAAAQPPAVKPANDVTISVGAGRMVKLGGTMTDLFVANDAIADVQVRSSNQIYIFGKSPGETTVFATDKGGRTIWSANVRVGNNIGSLDEFLDAAMPDAQIRAQPVNGMVLLTGTVATPADVEEATRLVQSYVGAGTQVISRVKTATPQQVMLRVKIAEVSRTMLRDIGFNITSSDFSGGSILGSFGRGRDLGVFDDKGLPTGTITRPAGTTTASIMGKVLGLDVAGALDLTENNGLVTTLAEPTLTALSGETASFLAGGEFPIAISNGLNGTSIEFKQFGVSLAFTPFVLEGGRISMRVRPEVSELSSAGAIKLSGYEIPALTVRRAETTVELGSGQSFMLGGLLSNAGNNSIEKTPFLGNLPVIGALFRSNSFKRNETELVIVVTPYLVKPVNANQIALPTDGFRSATTGERVMLGKDQGRQSQTPTPRPRSAEPQIVAPAIGAATARSTVPAAPAPAQTASAAPGFSF
ncbi:type II and III secretion system protein family protein [Sphingosinicella sp. BN140058]|uniref:type II and III secretion system protein family protein n=1 Tax=Sphingosinicella sp. BN140058 TaxID=1892855 RepID=UPI001012CB7F|nr:type II and III secretion system protein family protein [Sphingosinicella sp. BN140058]QAY79578.1 type II and III secretion system protein family protein [Sphingosinicella sp. BN140058]